MYRRIKIVADSNIPFLEGIFEPYADIDYIDGKDIVHNDIVDADALIIRTRTRCNEALLAGTPIWVCTVCGFVYIGEAPPQLCPVCKVPAWKFEQIEGRASA